MVKISSLILLCIGVLFFSNHTITKANTNDNFRLLKLHYENSTDEKGVTTFYYNQFGLMDKAKWQLLDGSRNSENYYTYDSHGNLIQKYREFSDGLISNIDFKYNENQLLISEHFKRSDGVKGETFYEYDENGKKIKSICKGLNGWFYGEIVYNYENEKNPKNAVIYQKGNESGKILYEYDNNNNLVKEVWDFTRKWTQTFIYEYEKYEPTDRIYYTSSNVFHNRMTDFKVFKENYDYSNQIDGPSHFFYDEDGKLIKKIFERTDNFKTETTYEFDEQGILKSSFRKYSNGQTATFTYEYNANRLLTNREFEKSDGSHGNEHYEYNGKWQLTKATYKNMDSWLSGTITFTYDLNGYLKIGVFKGEKFDADISFNCDDFGNVIKIHWDFSMGKTQTYLFEYEKI